MKNINTNNIWEEIKNGATYHLIMWDGCYLEVIGDTYGDNKEDVIRDMYDLEEFVHFNNPDTGDVMDIQHEWEERGLNVYYSAGYYEVWLYASKRKLTPEERDDIMDTALNTTLVNVNVYDSENTMYDCSGDALFESLEDAIGPSGYTTSNIVRAYKSADEFENFKEILDNIVCYTNGNDVEFEFDEYGVRVIYNLWDGTCASFCIGFQTADGFYRNAYEVYQNFDPEEWALEWAKQSEIHGIRQLLQDADEISEWLSNLSIRHRYVAA